MCLILFAYNSHPRYSLILAANRDEFYARATATAAFWADDAQILAGKDLVAGGTWLGITKTGRFAALTNYREISITKAEKSRGHLVSDFLREAIAAKLYLEKLQTRGANFSGFNLLVGNFAPEKNELGYFSNRENKVRFLQNGIYGLSNHLLDTDWHKVRSGKNALIETIAANRISPDLLFELLQQSDLANDADLPETGVDIERERFLSPIFIKTDVYGTRCSTVVLIEKDGTVTFAEKSFVPSLDSFYQFSI